MSKPHTGAIQLAELLPPAEMSILGPALAGLVGADLALLNGDGEAYWGVQPDAAHHEPLTLGQTPIGWLAGPLDKIRELKAAARLLQCLLKADTNKHHSAAPRPPEEQTPETSLAARPVDTVDAPDSLSEQLTALKVQLANQEERQQMLYEASKLAAVGQLAAGIAHEINNPLGFVRSNLSSFERYLQQFGQLKSHLNEGMAAWHALDLDFTLEDGQALLRDSIDGLDRISRIIAELKTFSNVDHASEEYGDLNECLTQAAKRLEGQLPVGIDIELTLQPLPSIVCLPGHLKQMFLGLLQNAAQAIIDAQHPGTIRVSSQAAQDGIHIYIADNGVGMSAATLSHVFEPFYTTRPVGEGTGLGLSSAHNIVHAHSGQITLESTLGEGTRLSLFFPRPTEQRACEFVPRETPGSEK